MSCSFCRREPKRMPYGAKGQTYCRCDTEMKTDVVKASARQKGKREIEKERKRLGK